MFLHAQGEAGGDAGGQEGDCSVRVWERLPANEAAVQYTPYMEGIQGMEI